MLLFLDLKLHLAKSVLEYKPHAGFQPNQQGGPSAFSGPKTLLVQLLYTLLRTEWTNTHGGDGQINSLQISSFLLGLTSSYKQKHDVNSKQIVPAGSFCPENNQTSCD